MTASEGEKHQPGWDSSDGRVILFEGVSWWLKVVDTARHVKGKRHDLGLGGCPVVSLYKARHKAFRNRGAIADGIDLLTEKRKDNVPTLREAVNALHAINKPQ